MEADPTVAYGRYSPDSCLASCMLVRTVVFSLINKTCFAIARDLYAFDFVLVGLVAESYPPSPRRTDITTTSFLLSCRFAARSPQSAARPCAACLAKRPTRTHFIRKYTIYPNYPSFFKPNVKLNFLRQGSTQQRLVGPGRDSRVGYCGADYLQYRLQRTTSFLFFLGEMTAKDSLAVQRAVD
uniref:Uncharacterized protein n=1 Tax=Nelumbo nucifera TaxID=4432 RepID=A0A822XKN4_NELNU|nr:TPA_asm: hypothetical protein HUJ06_021164 [Nelumbo nucifera]